MLLFMSCNRTTYIYMFCALVVVVNASSNHSRALRETLNRRSGVSLLPNKGNDIPEEITCYGLPYGGIGFTSHIITYYTLAFLCAGRSPWTWKKNKHWRFDFALAVLALLATTAATIITLVRCRNRWQFICLATWKICMSLTLTSISLHSALLVRKEHLSGDTNGTVLPWFVVYLAGIVAGLVGLLSLVRQGWDTQQVRQVTIHFSSVALTLVSMVLVFWLGYEIERHTRKGYSLLPTEDQNPDMLASRSERLEQGFMSDDLTSDHEREQFYASNESRSTSVEELRRPHEDVELEVMNDRNEPTDSYQEHKLTGSTNSASSWTTKLERGLRVFEQLIYSISIRQKVKTTKRQTGAGLWGVLGRVILFLAVSCVGIIGVFAALYSDFVLGALAKNMTGWPSSDNAVFYWIYFAAKRLPLLFV